MSELFESAWAATGRIEGGYVNDPSDSGGETNWGITKRVARANGYAGAMRDMNPDTAIHIAKRAYWDPMRLDDIAAISAPLIAVEIFDTSFNTGQQRAGEFLQRCLNAFNYNERHYADITVDGDIGSATLTALRHFIAHRNGQGIEVLHVALNCLQGAFYIDLAERRQKDEKYVYGWMLNRVVA